MLNRIELLTKARNLLHKQENEEEITNLDIILAHDLVDMVLDDIVTENYLNSKK